MKKSYRQSNLVNYFSCPRKFLLSQTIPFEKNKVMAEGHLFEGLVFGFKANHYTEFDLPIDCDIAAVPSKKFGITADSLDSYKRGAEYVKDLFLDGESYLNLSYEGENWILTGEADFLGNILFNGVVIRCIGDLKFTGNILKIWADKESTVSGFLQSIVYPYLWWKKTGEILPFIYVLVENEKSLPAGVAPIVKQMVYEPTLEKLEMLEQFLDQIDNDFEFQPKANACITGPYWNVECPYLMHCPTGRKLKEMPVIIPDLEWR